MLKLRNIVLEWEVYKIIYGSHCCVSYWNIRVMPAGWGSGRKWRSTRCLTCHPGWC